MQIDNKKHDVAARNRWYKMLNWKVHVEKIEEYLDAVCKQVKKAAFSENLYVSRNDEQRHTDHCF